MKRSSGFIACSPLAPVRAALGYLPDEAMLLPRPVSFRLPMVMMIPFHA